MPDASVLGVQGLPAQCLVQLRLYGRESSAQQILHMYPYISQNPLSLGQGHVTSYGQ